MRRLLIWIGLTRRLPNGKLLVPFHWPPYHVFICHWRHGGAKGFPRFYVFRNDPRVIKWYAGRMLPRRWGVGFCGIEFGDRG